MFIWLFYILIGTKQSYFLRTSYHGALVVNDIIKVSVSQKIGAKITTYVLKMLVSGDLQPSNLFQQIIVSQSLHSKADTKMWGWGNENNLL